MEGMKRWVGLGVIADNLINLGRFVADLSFERLSQDAAEVARTGFIDCIATMIDEGNPISPAMDIGNSGDAA